jgi:hypothetical protein
MNFPNFLFPFQIELDSESERLRKEQQANAVREEKKMILKRKLKVMEIREIIIIYNTVC